MESKVKMYEIVLSKDNSLNELLSVENKVFRLVEERGVAASKYNPVADKIIKFCEKQSKTVSEDNTITFYIPDELTKQIDFFDKLIIKVKIENNYDGKFLSGGGYCKLQYSNEIVNGKIKYGEIFIQGYAYYGILYSHTILTSLYHELNHCYDYYKDIIRYNGIAPRYLKHSRINKKETSFFENSFENNLFNMIVYRLFTETELNALIASVYGDLQGQQSVRKNFQIDIKHTQAYTIYNDIRTKYKSLFSKINEKNITQIKNYFRNLGVKITPYNDGIESFKKEIIRKTKYQLTRLIKGIGRAASVYYDNQEIKPIPKVMTLGHEPEIIK